MIRGMTNRQIWLEDSQPVEDLRFENVDGRYVKLKKVNISLAYLSLMLLALLILFRNCLMPLLCGSLQSVFWQSHASSTFL